MRYFDMIEFLVEEKTYDPRRRVHVVRAWAVEPGQSPSWWMAM